MPPARLLARVALGIAVVGSLAVVTARLSSTTAAAGSAASGKAGATSSIDSPQQPLRNRILLQDASREVVLDSWQAQIRVSEGREGTDQLELLLAASDSSESNIVSVVLGAACQRTLINVQGQYALGAVSTFGVTSAITWTTKAGTLQALSGTVTVDEHRGGRLEGTFNADFVQLDGPGAKRRVHGRFGGMVTLTCFASNSGARGVGDASAPSWTQVPITYGFCREYLGR